MRPGHQECFRSAVLADAARELDSETDHYYYHARYYDRSIGRFHRSLKEEEVWTAEYRSLEEARASITRWIEEYNHDRPHRGVQNRTPREALLAFTGVLKNEALTV